MFLVVSEIFSSLQGEGKYTGYPTTFIRLYGCNLKCTYCDTKYASDGRRKRMSIDSILSCVFKLGNSHICITGGEPLLQDSVYCLIYALVERGYKITIETNGAVPIDEVNYKRSYSYCMDIKCPSSRMEFKNVYTNMANLIAGDEVKFVIGTREDYEFAKEVLKKYPTKASIILSPCFSKIRKRESAEQLSNWLLEDKIPNARLGMQVHKFIGIK